MKLLIYTTVDDKYKVFQPLFEYCCRAAYPEYQCKVDYVDTDKLPEFYAPCYRFVNVPAGVEYDYVYITDVDIMIFREDVSILDFHLLEMEKSGLLYSNVISNLVLQGDRKVPLWDGARMAGTHFCNQDWYRQTYTAREKYHSELVKFNLGNEKSEDEEMLMKIVRESGLELPKTPYQFNERLHGIHLGNFRKDKPWLWKNTLTDKRLRQYDELKKDEQFAEIILKARENKIASEIFKRLDSLTGGFN